MDRDKVAEDGRERVAIGVLTYRRREMLVDLLGRLRQQIATAGVHGVVLVVDNDPVGSARDVAAEREGVVYVHEPVPGIAAARHRCLQEAAGFDLLQFIDDDEVPADGWLSAMLDAWRAHARPGAVAGVVWPRFLSQPDPWITAGGFFTRTTHPTGTALRAAPCGNLLIDVAQVTALGVQFDPSLGLRGGEDTLFTRQLVARGGRIVSCAEAGVYDLIPAGRATRAWVLERAWQHGATSTRIDLMLADGRVGRGVVRLRRAVGGCARAVVGGAQALVGAATRDDARHARGLRMQRRGAGMAKAAVGTTREEYSR